MTEIANMLRNGKTHEAWQRACGFIDLSIDEFMMVQRRLLGEQIDILKQCEMGKKLMHGANPHNISEFRRWVSLTNYDDYAPYLLEKREDALPVKSALWQYTSGKSGEYPFRWVPVPERQLKEIESLLFALLFFSGCKEREDVAFKEHDKVLYGMAPPPYATGTMARVFSRDLFDFLPSLDEAEQMAFEDRMQRGFELALSKGMDVCLALSSVAVAIGERFNQRSGHANVKALMKNPRIAVRLARGMLKARLAHRPLMLKDLWSVRGLITFGADTSVFKDKIKESWGKEPLEFHGCTEAVVIAMQTWDRRGMTFIPNLNFFEFIPENESIKSREDPSYQPSTLLMDEVKPGNYELVITSLHGGPFVRYRLGHMIRIISKRNEQLNIDIPQMVFLSRIDDQIDIAGFTRLSEKVIWQAIENAGLSYEDWVARKEVNEKPALHLYIELKSNGVSPESIADRVHKELKKLDIPYAELESFLHLRPLEVTLLPHDSFIRYKSRQQSRGADLTQMKPAHINPSDESVNFLLSAATRVEVTTEENPKVLPGEMVEA